MRFVDRRAGLSDAHAAGCKGASYTGARAPRTKGTPGASEGGTSAWSSRRRARPGQGFSETVDRALKGERTALTRNKRPVAANYLAFAAKVEPMASMGLLFDMIQTIEEKSRRR
jgi:hypothetical protein